MGCAVNPPLKENDPIEVKVVGYYPEGGFYAVRLLASCDVRMRPGEIRRITFGRGGMDVAIMREDENGGHAHSVICWGIINTPEIAAVVKSSGIVKLHKPSACFGFLANPPNTKVVLLIVSGLGISRIYPSLRQLMTGEEVCEPMDIQLFFAAENRSDLAFTSDLDAWEADQFRNSAPHSHYLSVQYVILEPDSEWGGLTGTVTSKTLLTCCEVVSATCYVSGDDDFVTDVCEELAFCGVSREMIYTSAVTNNQTGE